MKNEVNRLELFCIRNAITQEMIYLPEGITFIVLNPKKNACAFALYQFQTVVVRGCGDLTMVVQFL